MHTLKAIAQRSTMFGAVFALVAATVIPSAVALADELNPLTERSLLLSSSAPGYKDTDGSGNSTAFPNAVGENYAPAGSGPNGKKTGETFTFKVSSDGETHAMQLQYCTTAAGNCQAPGDAGKIVPGYIPGDAATQGDARDGVYDPGVNDAGRPTNAQAHPEGFSDLEVLDGWTQGTGAGQFQVYVDDVVTTANDWVMAVSNDEDDAHSGALTGKNNFISLTSVTGDEILNGEEVRIVFTPSETVYITNPGSGSFFVKMNTYGDVGATEYINGGVTVANVMTDSIHITTKVLETMSFSVGTQNRDTVVVECEAGQTNVPEGCESETAVHGTCDPIQQINNNQLQLGNPDAEFSLETDTAWDVHSYWRLSSNSSGGATVYYSGNTLANTVGDQIAPIGATAASSTPGTEQFGLGFVPADEDTFDPAFSNGTDGLVETDEERYKLPTLVDDLLVPGTEYANGTGNIQTVPEDGGAPTAAFAFEQESNTDPRSIATNNDNVISCATAKMRYVANIGADTPAGVYTTKVNYLAAPQY